MVSRPKTLCQTMQSSAVQLLEDVDAPVLVGVEERLAQLADLVLVHHRRANFPESRYSNSFVILPSRTSATRHADSGTLVPLWATTFTVYCTTKPSSKVLMMRSS